MLTDKFIPDTKKPIKIFRFVKSLPGIFITFRYLKVKTDVIDQGQVVQSPIKLTQG